MAQLTVADLARATRDNSGGGFLSKITRSPSKKQKSTQALLSPTSSGPHPSFPQNNRSQEGSISKRPQQSRPAVHRNPTAPAAPVSLNSLQTDLARIDDVLGGNVDGPLHGAQSTTPLTVSRSAEATPTRPDVTPMADFQPVVGFNPPQSGGTAAQNPSSIFQHIQDMSNKRIGTLDYMRKAHEGRIHWFNTVHFSKADISRLPSYAPNRLSRRATNYFILGLSLPAVLDVYQPPHPQSPASANTSVAGDFLRSLNQLLVEFETFQQHHPPDGSSASSLSRAKIPQMFRRAPTIGKPRRVSGAAGTEIGLPMQPKATSPPADSNHLHAATPSIDTTSSGNTHPLMATSTAPSSQTSLPSSTFPSPTVFPTSSPFDSHANATLLPNEGPYTYLVTPPLPFAPDFYCIFSTVCDVLIDAYQRLLQIINAPSVCTVALGDLFTKADARLRKVMVGGIVKEFEAAGREGAKRELAGVQRLVLGGLMGG